GVVEPSGRPGVPLAAGAGRGAGSRPPCAPWTAGAIRLTRAPVEDSHEPIRTARPQREAGAAGWVPGSDGLHPWRFSAAAGEVRDYSWSVAPAPRTIATADEEQ